MHYGDKGFVKNDTLLSFWVNTAHPQKPGTAKNLSPSDKERLNKLCKCKDGNVGDSSMHGTQRNEIEEMRERFCGKGYSGPLHCDCCKKHKDACNQMRIESCMGMCNSCCRHQCEKRKRSTKKLQNLHITE